MYETRILTDQDAPRAMNGRHRVSVFRGVDAVPTNSRLYFPGFSSQPINNLAVADASELGDCLHRQVPAGGSQPPE